MRRIAFLVFLTILATFVASCGQATYNPTELYTDGTKAVYKVFVNDEYSGEAVYTFKHIEHEKTPAIQIDSVTDLDYKNAITSQNNKIHTVTKTIVRKSDWRPLYAYFKNEWKGTEEGWHETESKYGEMIVNWTAKGPNGSFNHEVKFREDYFDDDEVLWLAPTLGYKKDFKKLYTNFTNRTAQPTQGVIFMGDVHEIDVRGKKYEAWAAGLRVNEIVQRVWYDTQTGYLLRYEQDMGFLAFPDFSEKEAGYKPPVTTYAMVLDSWTPGK